MLKWLHKFPANREREMNKQSHANGNISEKSRQQSDKVTNIALVVLTALGLFASGCGWQTYRLYDGPERPLKEVTVLVVLSPLELLTVDNKDNIHSPSPLGGPTEYHLEPGQHKISVKYSGLGFVDGVPPMVGEGEPITFKEFKEQIGSAAKMRVASMVGEPFTFSEEFEPGYVYMVWPIVTKSPTPKDLYTYEGGLYTCKLQRLTFESYSANIAGKGGLRQQHWVDTLDKSLRTFSVRDSISLEGVECSKALGFRRPLEWAYDLNERSKKEMNTPGSYELLAGEYEQAIQMFSAALQSSKESHSIRINRGVAYERTGRLQEALEDFSQVPEESPYHGLALLNRAVVKYRMGDMQGAREDIQMAQQLNAPGIGRAIQWADHILSGPGQ